MTSTQKAIQRKLQLERQILSVQLQKANDSETLESVRTVDAQMHKKLQVRLASIERALHRLERGTFGVCQSCDEEIDSARLKALPYAEQCIECQRQLERKTIRPYAYRTSMRTQVIR
jgi:RNA polymerase-binding transcription factor DksA